MTETVVQRFDSIGAFCAEVDTRTSANDKAKYGRDFTGDESWQDSRTHLLKGKLEVVPRANELVDKLLGEGVELEQTQWQQSVAGYLPCVPAYLADQPETMFMPTQVKSDTAPVRIFASVCCSAGIDAEKMEKRGTTILALCMKLSSVRPVELYVYADMGGHGFATMPVVKIETSPLDLATATYALSSAGFLRNLCFGWAYTHGWNGAWAWDTAPWLDGGKAKTAEALGATADDLVIIGTHLHDPLVDTPVEWLNEQMERFAKTHEEA